MVTIDIPADPLSEVATPQLMEQYGRILTILRERGITRTEDSPVGGYAEYLVAKAFHLTLAPNSGIGYDASMVTARDTRSRVGA